MSTQVVESPLPVADTPAAKVAAGTATPDDFFKHNLSEVVKAIINIVPFRHEGEANRILIALDNLHTDISEVLKQEDPIAPTVGQPDPVLNALLERVKEQDSKIDRLIEALSGNKTVQAAMEETPAAVPATPAEPVTPLPPVAEVTPASYPPGWTKDEGGNWVAVQAPDPLVTPPPVS